MSKRTGDQTIIATFYGATRYGTSTMGNPTWTLHTSEGDFRTKSNTSLGYTVSNHLNSETGMVGSVVEFTATRAGRVWDMRLSSPRPVVGPECPVCGEKVEAGRPRVSGSAADVDASRLQHRHDDGEPLCPEMTSAGYQPSLPVRRA